MNIIPISQTKFSQKGSFLTRSPAPKEQQTRSQTSEPLRTDSEYIPPLNADLDFIVHIFCLIGLVLVFCGFFFLKG